MRRALLSLCLLGTAAWANPAVPAPLAIKPDAALYPKQEDSFQVIGWLPRSFLLNGGYAMKLTIKEMRIDHVAEQSRATMARRACTISFSYSQPVGAELFSSRFDMPLLASERITSQWRAGSWGDYIIHLSDTPLRSKSFRLMANAKF
jgi:hypothetical protein